MSISLKSGLLVIVSAPSGAGKTTLVAALLKQMGNLSLSISHTTRPKRPKEVDGQNYHFIAGDDFERMREAGEFLEHADVFGNKYATSRNAVNDQLESGLDVILEIDWQGAQQVRKNFGSSIGIFILPPSKAALRQRLKSRAQDKPEVIEQRMAKAVQEMSHYAEFDYLIINDDFEQAVLEMGCIIRSARLRLLFQKAQYGQLIGELLETSLESK